MAHPPLIDAYGREVSDSEPTYQVVGPSAASSAEMGSSVFLPNPNYNPNPVPVAYSFPPPGQNPVYTSPVTVQPPAPAPIPPSHQVTFDTIGQVLVRGIGNARYALQIIWAQGIQESGDVTQAATLTFAAAVCAPIDPLEDGSIIGMFDGGNLIFDITQGGGIVPATWAPADGVQLLISLLGTIVYPGTEAQEPAPIIQEDKGVALTNAFRGIRYIIFPDYPITAGLPSLSIIWSRTNSLAPHHGSIPPTPSPPSAAVEFAAGSG